MRRIHERISKRRMDFAHAVSHRHVSESGVIVFESLTVTRMIKKHALATRIHPSELPDAAWNHLFTFTRYKAEEAGAVGVQIDPRGTSQRCSACGAVVQKKPGIRVHQCPACGLEIDCDLKPTLNIVGVGLHAIGRAP